MGHKPISLACLWINLLSSYSCSCMTSILVAGVERTVWTQSCPLSVRCSLGGRISPKRSYVWCRSSYFCCFLPWAVLAEPLTSTGVEYFTREPCQPSIFELFVTSYLQQESWQGSNLVNLSKLSNFICLSNLRNKRILIIVLKDDSIYLAIKYKAVIMFAINRLKQNTYREILSKRKKTKKTLPHSINRLVFNTPTILPRQSNQSLLSPRTSIEKRQKPQALENKFIPLFEAKFSSQQNNLNSHNKSKIDLIMFNLCKTVKIYQTINHYHSNEPSNLVDSHQINYSENVLPSSHDLAIKTIESHTISHPKSRTGISVSIKKASSVSPRKKYANQRHNSDLLAVSHQLHFLDQSKSKQTQFNSIKLKTTNRYDNDSPLFVESKITYGEMSPKIHICEPLEVRFSLPESDHLSLTDLPLKREETRTTQQSVRKSEPKIQINISPLKKSAVFIRNTHFNKQEQSQTIKNSMMESSFKNSIDFKLSSSKIKSKDITDSLLKLSSSFSQILDKTNNQHPADQLSRTCSLQLKNDEYSASIKKQESGFLKEYVCQVNQSIILAKHPAEKGLKIVKSNNDLLHKLASQQFKPSLSNILQRQDSPVKRLKKRYGENLLNPYDKQTIVSKSFASRSNESLEKKQIIDESIIIQHSIQANRFLPLKDRAMNRQHFRIYLAIEKASCLLVAIKELPINRIQNINHQLRLYRDIESSDLDISRLYQMYTHGTSYILIKQPYECTLHEFIERNSQEYVLISWEFIIRSIEDMLRKVIACMAKKDMHLRRLISSQDIVYVFGEWKLDSPQMFALPGVERESTSLVQVMRYLKEEIQGRIRESKNLN